MDHLPPRIIEPTKRQVPVRRVSNLHLALLELERQAIALHEAAYTAFPLSPNSIAPILVDLAVLHSKIAALRGSIL